LPCGTGKSLIVYFIANAVQARTVIVAVPSLNLIKQMVRVWLREEVARGRLKTDWLCVASDDTVGEVDDVADERADIGLPTTTDVNEIADRLNQRTSLLGQTPFAYMKSITRRPSVGNATGWQAPASRFPPILPSFRSTSSELRWRKLCGLPILTLDEGAFFQGSA
jgi:hypothetical protein